MPTLIRALFFLFLSFLFWSTAVADQQCLNDIFSIKKFTSEVEAGTANDPLRDPEINILPRGSKLDLNSKKAKPFAATSLNSDPLPLRNYENLYDLPRIKVDIDFHTELTANGAPLSGPLRSRAYLGRVRGTGQAVMTIPFYNTLRPRDNSTPPNKTIGDWMATFIIGQNSRAVEIAARQQDLDRAALALANLAIDMGQVDIFPRLVGVSKDNSGNHYLSFEFVSGKKVEKFSYADLIDAEVIMGYLNESGLGGPTIGNFISSKIQWQRISMLDPTTGLSFFRTDDGRLLIFPNGGFLLSGSGQIISPNATNGPFAFQRARALLATPSTWDGFNYLTFLRSQNGNDINPGAWHGLMGTLEILASQGVAVPEVYLDMANNR